MTSQFSSSIDVGSPTDFAAPTGNSFFLEQINDRGEAFAIHPILGTEALIGAAANCDIKLPELGRSGPSVFLSLKNGQWTAKCVAGTLTAAGRQVVVAKLQVGDTLAIGTLNLRLQDGNQVANSSRGKSRGSSLKDSATNLNPRSGSASDSSRSVALGKKSGQATGQGHPSKLSFASNRWVGPSPHSASFNSESRDPKPFAETDPANWEAANRDTAQPAAQYGADQEIPAHMAAVNLVGSLEKAFEKLGEQLESIAKKINSDSPTVGAGAVGAVTPHAPQEFLGGGSANAGTNRTLDNSAESGQALVNPASTFGSQPASSGDQPTGDNLEKLDQLVRRRMRAQRKWLSKQLQQMIPPAAVAVPLNLANANSAQPALPSGTATPGPAMSGAITESYRNINPDSPALDLSALQVTADSGVVSAAASGGHRVDDNAANSARSTPQDYLSNSTSSMDRYSSIGEQPMFGGGTSDRDNHRAIFDHESPASTLGNPVQSFGPNHLPESSSKSSSSVWQGGQPTAAEDEASESINASQAALENRLAKHIGSAHGTRPDTSAKQFDQSFRTQHTPASPAYTDDSFDDHDSTVAELRLSGFASPSQQIDSDDDVIIEESYNYYDQNSDSNDFSVGLDNYSDDSDGSEYGNSNSGAISNFGDLRHFDEEPETGSDSTPMIEGLFDDLRQAHTSTYRKYNDDRDLLDDPDSVEYSAKISENVSNRLERLVSGEKTTGRRGLPETHPQDSVNSTPGHDIRQGSYHSEERSDSRSQEQISNMPVDLGHTGFSQGQGFQTSQNTNFASAPADGRLSDPNILQALQELRSSIPARTTQTGYVGEGNASAAPEFNHRHEANDGQNQPFSALNYQNASESPENNYYGAQNEEYAFSGQKLGDDAGEFHVPEMEQESTGSFAFGIESQDYEDNPWDRELDRDPAEQFDPGQVEATIPLSMANHSLDNSTAEVAPELETLHGSLEEDESVESYMQRLLARMRGSEEPAPPTQLVAKPTPPPAKPIAPVPTAAPATNDSQATIEEIVEEFDPEKYLPRISPELNSDMAALRQLANDSARSAIMTSHRRQTAAKIAFKLCVACIGFIVAFALFIVNGFRLNLIMVASVAAVLMTLLWGYDVIQQVGQMKGGGDDFSSDGKKSKSKAKKTKVVED